MIQGSNGRLENHGKHFSSSFSLGEVKAEGMNHSKVFILEPIGMALNIVGLGLTEPMKIMVRIVRMSQTRFSVFNRCWAFTVDLQL